MAHDVCWLWMAPTLTVADDGGGVRINLCDALSALLNYSEFLVSRWSIDWQRHDSYLYYSKTDRDLEISQIYESKYEAM